MKLYSIAENSICNLLKDYMDSVDDNWNYITSEELKEKLDNGSEKYFLLDIRDEEKYKEGHIKEAENIFWKDLLESKNLEKLPKDQTIILICYVGHTASQMMVALRLLGYDVITLKFGMGNSPVEGVPVAGWLDYGFETVEK